MSHGKKSKRRTLGYVPYVEGVTVLTFNTSEQPWEKQARKDEERLEKHPNLGWNDRRYVREEVKRLAQAGELSHMESAS